MESINSSTSAGSREPIQVSSSWMFEHPAQLPDEVAVPRFRQHGMERLLIGLTCGIGARRSLGDSLGREIREACLNSANGGDEAARRSGRGFLRRPESRFRRSSSRFVAGRRVASFIANPS